MAFVLQDSENGKTWAGPMTIDMARSYVKKLIRLGASPSEVFIVEGITHYNSYNK